MTDRNAARGLDRRLRFAGLLGIVASTAIACATPGHERLPSIGVAMLLDDGVQVLRVEVDSYYFEPSRVMVKVGVPVRLVIESGTLLRGHNFSLFAPEAGIEVNTHVPARQRVTVQFLPRAVGEFAFTCNIDDHSARGMEGTLVVVESLPGIHRTR